MRPFLRATLTAALVSTWLAVGGSRLQATQQVDLRPPPADRPGQTRPTAAPPEDEDVPLSFLDRYPKPAAGRLDPRFVPPARLGPLDLSVPSAGLQNPRLGLNFSNYDDLYPEARAAGASHDRVTFSMSTTEPEPGRFFWDDYDKLVAAASARNVQVLGVLVDPPNWAGDASQPHPVWWVPRGLDRPWNDPANVWANWVGATVRHYRGNVRAWEVWNEPNIEFWGGTAAQFARLLKVTYQAIKANDPGATVVFGGVYKANNWGRVQQILAALKADPEGARSKHFFDVFGIHVYDAGICEQFDLIGALKKNVDDMTSPHPVWVTESGIRVWPSPNPGYALPNEQSSFLIQNYAYALYAGAERYYYWRANDAGDRDQPWGLWTDARQVRPSFTAFQVAATKLPVTYTWAFREWANGGAVSRITFYGTPLGKVTVLWNAGNTAQRYDLGAALAVATVTRPDGSAVQRTQTSGAWAFDLPAAPNFRWAKPGGECQVASEPLIITERDTTPPTIRLGATQIGTNVARLTWQGFDPNGRGDDGVSGIWSYDIQMRINRGPWTTLAEWQTTTSLRVPTRAGNTYTFRARARDRAGNEQSWASARVAVLFAR